MEIRDYYTILELTPEASEEEIKQAYRRLARKFHPDVSQATDAEQRFQEIQEAYEVLKDPQKRLIYTQSTKIIKPYTIAWLRAKKAAWLHSYAQKDAKKAASIRANVNFINPPEQNSRSTVLGIITAILVLSVILAYFFNQASTTPHHQDNLATAILQQDATAIATLETLEPGKQSAILQTKAAKVALIEFYIKQQDKEVLTKLAGFDPIIRQDLLQEQVVKKQLFDYYGAKITNAVNTNNIDQALQWVKSLQRDYEDSKKLSEWSNQLERLKQQQSVTMVAVVNPVTPINQTPSAETTLITSQDLLPSLPTQQDKPEETVSVQSDMPLSDTQPIEPLPDTIDEPEVVSPIKECQQLYHAHHVSRGAKNALDCYRHILRKSPNHREALAGIKGLENDYQNWARNALKKQQFDKVAENLLGLERVNPYSPALAELRQLLQTAKATQTVTIPPTKVIPETVQPTEIHQNMSTIMEKCARLNRKYSVGIESPTIEEQSYLSRYCH